MMWQPFQSLKPFQDVLSVALFTKEDATPTEEEIAEKLGASGFVALAQVHGTKTVVVHEESNRTIEADGMMTNQSDLALTLRIADCQPMLIFAPEKNVLSLLHVGWKGLQGGAIQEFFIALKENFGIEAQETLVCAGPSLCQTCAGFSDPETELSTVDPKFVSEKNVDLRSAADAVLVQCGVPQEKIERVAECTRCDPHTFWSYRGGDREAVKAGCTNVLACALKKL